MHKCKGLDFLGYLMVACAGVLIAYIRFVGIDLTEGRLLVEYWAGWVAVLLLCFIGSGIVCRPKV